MLRILLEIGLICYRLLNVGRDPVAGVAAFRRSRNIQWDKCPGDVAPSSPTPVPRTTDSSNKWSESARNRTAFHANLPFKQQQAQRQEERARQERRDYGNRSGRPSATKSFVPASGPSTVSASSLERIAAFATAAIGSCTPSPGHATGTTRMTSISMTSTGNII